ncbi:unnamed protein product [Calicophoron daubneyi]|uniref:Tetratricopeptide repeat protein 21B n=1 Tax=Calicophoron daubneyi TaxID=300641 RepID=A0AAV2TL47_CALDB
MAFCDQELMAKMFYYLREGYPNHAADLAESSLKKYPNDPTLKIHMGCSAIIEGKTQEAIRRFNDLRDKEDYSLAAYVALVHACKKMPDAGHDAVKEFEGKVRESRRHASDMALYFAGLVLFFFQRYEKSREYIERSLKANLLFREALTLNGWIDLMGNDESLQKKCIRYFEESTNDEEAMTAECLMGKSKYFQCCNSLQSALDMLNVAVVNYPTYLPALLEKMHIQLMLQDWDQTIDTAQRCISMEPMCIEALKHQLLFMMCKKGSLVESRKKLDELALALQNSEPNYSGLYRELSGLFASVCNRDPVILQKLAQLAEKAAILDPRDDKCAINLGKILLTLGRPKEASGRFQRALELCETSIVGLQGIVRCQLAQGCLKEASNQLEFLSELQPTIGKSAELNYMAAVLGRKQAASTQKILAYLDEAVAIQFKKFQGKNLSPEYYEAMDPDFLIQIVTEYLYLAPQQPPSTGANAMISNSTEIPKSRGDPILMRCLNVLEPLTAVAPGIQWAVYLLAHVHYLLGNTMAALSSVKSCLELDQTLVEGHILLAQIYLYQANLKMAEQALEAGLSNNFEVRNHPLYQLVKARLLIKQGSAKVAIQILKQTIASVNSSSANRAGSAPRNPSFAKSTGFGSPGLSNGDRLSLYLELAEAHRSLNEMHEATKVIQDAQLAFAGSTEAGRVTVATADLALNQGDHEAALITLRTIRPDQPYYLIARQHMADIYLNHRKEKKLYAACYRELADKLDTTEAHLLLGDAYMTIQEPERAMEVYEGVLRKNPNDLRLAMKMGQALVKTHHYGKAVSYYEAAVKGGQKALCLDLVDLLIKLKQYEKARKILTPLITESSADSDSLESSEVRRALQLLGSLSEAESLKANEQIDLLNQIKAVHARRLARVQTAEVGDVVAEQRLAMGDICLQLAKIHTNQLRVLMGDRKLVIADRERTKDDKSESTKSGDEVSKADPNSLTFHQETAAHLCNEVISQVAAIAGCKTVDSRRPATLGLIHVMGGGELSRIRRATVRMEATALSQLASLYLTALDYANCEQATLKLAQLQEELESCDQSNLNPMTCSEPTPQDSQRLPKPNVQASTATDLTSILVGLQPAASVMAELMYAKADFESASKHLESIMRKNPTDYQTLARLIDALRRAGNLQRVPEFLDKSKNTDPRGDSSTGYNYCRGLYHWITGEATLALQHFNRARADVDYTEKAVYRMAEICLNPDNHVPTGDGGDLTFTGNNCNSGVNTAPSVVGQLAAYEENARNVGVGYDTAEQLLKELHTVKDKKRFRFLKNTLLLMTRSKTNVESALESFAQMAKEEPDNGTVIYGAAACYMMLKQTQKAKNQLKRLAKVPWNVQEAEELEKAWLLLADIYIQSGKSDLSHDLLKRCLQYNKSCTKAYEYTGYIREKEQNFQEAARNYELAWTNSNKQNPSIGYKLAYNYLKIRQLIEAVQICLQVLSVCPNYPKIRKEILDKARMGLRT